MSYKTHIFIVAFLQNAPIEYSSKSVCVCACVCTSIWAAFLSFGTCYEVNIMQLCLVFVKRICKHDYILSHSAQCMRSVDS